MDPEANKIYAISGRSMGKLLQENHIRRALGDVSIVEMRGVSAMVVLDKPEASVQKTKTVTLKAAVLPEGSVVTWASSDTTKATVSNKGVVTGVATGSCVISASITVGGVTYKDVCNLTVTN